MPSDFIDAPSTAYYHAHADRFFAETVALDLTPLYAPFLARLPVGGTILDAGCGSGRDARAFLERGYTVSAFDASPSLARLAAAHTGLPVTVQRFQELDESERFDGIWACASLLHVPLADLPDVLRRLARALKPEGVLYASWKYGQGERQDGNRRFTDLDEAGLDALLQTLSIWTPLTVWTSADRRPDRPDALWLNALLRRTVQR
ncbi:MAG: hypothetical protein QG599_879 [Pseudomonadota bacterium]|nr:hypothetical protein [Pseudomonadota bacterium]